MAWAQLSRTIDSEALKPGAISGEIVGSSGRGVAGALVRILPINQSATTDRRGQFSFPEIAPGTYTVAVSASGFVPARIVDVVVTPARATAIGALELAPGFSPNGVQELAEYVVHADQLLPLQMTAFTVAPTNYERYMPAEITTGSRVATRVDEVPYAVNVITSEFVRDFLMFELAEELAYASSLTGFDEAGLFTLRGFGGNIVLRNGFARLGLQERSSIDRIEVIKGPAAAIYGQTLPGGVINLITRRPTTTPRQNLSVAAGSHNLERIELGASGPVRIGEAAPRLFYAFSTSYYSREYEGPAQSTDTRTGALALTYKFSGETNLTAVLDYNRRRSNVAPLPYVFDRATGRYRELAWDLVDRTYASPADWTDRSNYSLDLFFEHRLAPWLALRAGGNIYRSPRYFYSSVNSSAFDPDTRELVNRGSRTSFNFLRGDGQSGAVDLLASYRLGGTEHKTLFTVDYYNNAGKRPLYASRTPDVPATMSVDAPVFVPFRGFSDADYAPTRFRDDYNRATGVFLRQQVSAWDGRLVGVAGVRFDHVAQYTYDQLVTPAATTEFEVDDFNRQLGFNYRVSPGITFYANRTESFIPNDSALIAAGRAEPLANRKGVGYEIGLKAALLDERLTFTTDLYSVRLRHAVVTAVDSATLQTFPVAAGRQASDGFEFDGNWRVNDRLQALVSYSYTDSEVTSLGRDHDMERRAPRAAPRHSFGGALAWDVTPAFSANLSVRYYSSFSVDTNGGIVDPATGLIFRNDGRREIRAPSYAVWNAGVAYRWKFRRSRGEHVVRCAVKNLLDRRYIIVGANRTIGDDRGIYFSYSLER